MTQAKITITRTRRGLGFPDTQRYVKPLRSRLRA